MKILLDECLPIDFRHSFPNHEIHTAQWAGLKGKKNGELLRADFAAAISPCMSNSNRFAVSPSWMVPASHRTKCRSKP